VPEVVRVERAAGHVRVAVHIHSYRFDARETPEAPNQERIPESTQSQRSPGG